MQYFAMSRFLYRLSKLEAADRFILKGAPLLHALDIAHARSTLDIDLLAAGWGYTGKAQSKT